MYCCVAAHLGGFEEDSRSEVNLAFSTGTVISMFVPTVHAFDSMQTSSRNVCCWVAAHLRGFEEDCTGLGFQANVVEEYVPLSALQHIFAGLKRTRDQKLSSASMSGHLSSAITG